MSMLLDAGDEILIPNPGYPTFAMTARLLHAVPVEYPAASCQRIPAADRRH